MISAQSSWGYVATPGFDEWEAKRVIDALVSLGYGAVEWTLSHFNPRDHSPAELEALVGYARGKGLASCQIAVLQDYISGDAELRRDRVALTRETLTAASISGVAMVGIYAGPDSWDPGAAKIPGDVSADDAWSRLFAALDELYPIAEREGITLTFKPCVSTLAYDYFSSLPVIERYGTSSAFGVTLDPSHFILHGNDIAWVVAQLGQLLKHVHLKDVFGVPGDEGRHFMFPLLGDGQTNWAALRGALDELGFAGTLAILFEAYAYFDNVLGGDPVAAARLSLEQAREIWGRYGVEA